MKKLIRHFAVDTFSLYAVSKMADGLVFEKGLESLFLAGVGLMIASLVAKPIINILLLPINLVTFNLFRWISSALALYLVTLVVPGFKVLGFSFSGFSGSLFSLPPIYLVGFMAIVAYSFILSVLASFIYWIIS